MSTATKTRPRLWRYEVTEVLGSMVGKLEVGAVIIDRWKGRGEQHWNLHHIPTMEWTGGWSARLIGEAPPDACEKVYADWDAAVSEETTP